MTLKAKLDETKDVDHQDRGEFIKPVETGDPHANRKADKSQGDATDLDTAPTENRDPKSKGDTHANRKADVKTKSGAMKEAVDALAGLTVEQIDEILASLDKKEVVSESKDTLSEIAMTDLNEVFGSLELSDDFKTKATIIFEANVNSVITSKVAELEESYAVKFENLREEVTAEISESMEASVDRYLTFVAEQWLKDNEVAVEAGLRVEQANSFWDGLKDLFETHSIDIPTEKVDAVETLQTEMTELTTKLNEANEAIIAGKALIEGFAKKEAFNTLTEGLTVVQKDKLVKLTESIAHTDVEDYKTKVSVLKESVISAGKETPKAETLNESEVGNAPAPKSVGISAYDPLTDSVFRD